VTLFAVKSHFRYGIIRRIFGGGMGVIHDAERLGAWKVVKPCGSTNVPFK
jgi:lipoate-protein ligase A